MKEEKATTNPFPGAPEALPDLVNFGVNRGGLRESRAIYRREMEKWRRSVDTYIPFILHVYHARDE